MSDDYAFYAFCIALIIAVVGGYYLFLSLPDILECLILKKKSARTGRGVQVVAILILVMFYTALVAVFWYFTYEISLTIAGVLGLGAHVVWLIVKGAPANEREQ